MLLHMQMLAFPTLLLGTWRKGHKGSAPCVSSKHRHCAAGVKGNRQTSLPIFTVPCTTPSPPCTVLSCCPHTVTSAANPHPHTQPNLNMFSSSQSKAKPHSTGPYQISSASWYWSTLPVMRLQGPSPNQHSTQNTQNLCNNSQLSGSTAERNCAHKCARQRWGTRHSAESYEQSLSLDHRTFLCACECHLWSWVYCGYSLRMNKQASWHYKQTKVPQPLTTSAGPTSDKKSSELCCVSFCHPWVCESFSAALSPLTPSNHGRVTGLDGNTHI